MGFIHTSDEGGAGPLHVTATPEMWLYAGVTVPLTVLTLVGWYFWEALHRRKSPCSELIDGDVEKAE